MVLLQLQPPPTEKITTSSAHDLLLIRGTNRVLLLPETPNPLASMLNPGCATGDLGKKSIAQVMFLHPSGCEDG